MKYETITEIVESLINGNYSEVKPKVKRMSKKDFLTFQEILTEYAEPEKAARDLDILTGRK